MMKCSMEAQNGGGGLSWSSDDAELMLEIRTIVEMQQGLYTVRLALEEMILEGRIYSVTIGDGKAVLRSNRPHILADLCMRLLDLGYKLQKTPIEVIS